MVNYFFFISQLRRNEQGEMRTVLVPLPNQTTWNNSTRGLVPVRTDLHVQADSESLGRIVRTPVGTFWGVCIEGNTPLAASLKTYHRNDRDFYRVTNVVKEEDFDESMTLAYCEVTSRREPELPMDGAHAEPVRPANTQNTRNTRNTQNTQGMPVIHNGLASSRDFVEGLKNSTEDLSDGDMLELARLYDMLSLGIVSFSYIKNSDSSVRRAKGTRNPGVIRMQMILTDGDDQRASAAANDQRARTPFDGVHVAYFDLDRCGWRSFTVDNYVDTEDGTFTPASPANAA